MDRIDGKKLTLSVDGDDWAGEVQSYTVAGSESSDDVTFAQAAAGAAADYELTLVVEQDMSSGSAFRYIWDHVGEEDVAVVLAPYANATPTADKPHFEFTVDMPSVRPDLGGDAGVDGKKFKSTVVLKVTDGADLDPVTA